MKVSNNINKIDAIFIELSINLKKKLFIFHYKRVSLFKPQNLFLVYQKIISIFVPL